MYPFIYQNLITGERVYSFKKLKDKNLKPIFERKDTAIKSNKVYKKKYE